MHAAGKSKLMGKIRPTCGRQYFIHTYFIWLCNSLSFATMNTFLTTYRIIILVVNTFQQFDTLRYVFKPWRHNVEHKLNDSRATQPASAVLQALSRVTHPQHQIPATKYDTRRVGGPVKQDAPKRAHYTTVLFAYSYCQRSHCAFISCVVTTRI